MPVTVEEILNDYHRAKKELEEERKNREHIPRISNR